nr:Rv1535 domain-containing protein [Mycobacterium cookii]
MSTTKEALADPLGGAVAGLLTVPLIELYALLWRVGAVEVVGTRRPNDRHHSAPVAAYLRMRGSQRRPRPSQPRLSPAPAPKRSGREACTQAVG